MDGDKHTAWTCTVVLPYSNGTDMADVDQDEAGRLVIEAAAGSWTGVGSITRRLRASHEAM